jgi:hypothetical protein
MQPAEHSQGQSVVKKSEYCRNHPSVKTSWRCIECGREYCEDCVTPIRHSMSHVNRTAVCPECKSCCIDFQQIEIVARERRGEIKARKKSLLKLLSAAAIATLILIVFLGLAPFEFVIPVLLILAVLAGVLRMQGHLDRGVGGDSVFSFADSYIDTDSLITRKRPVVIILIIIVILAILFLVIRFKKYGW